ncbi:MAG: LPXTG cell wall anchor domain-containing protein [Lactobacillales bacterium]|jgi:LPXTG-motif cell wall-anchored protein|nr:LPXTG cell wall anchor domain-containing protein [Lactobacillales bacterium]
MGKKEKSGQEKILKKTGTLAVVSMLLWSSGLSTIVTQATTIVEPTKEAVSSSGEESPVTEKTTESSQDTPVEGNISASTTSEEKTVHSSSEEETATSTSSEAPTTEVSAAEETETTTSTEAKVEPKKVAPRANITPILSDVDVVWQAVVSAKKNIHYPQSATGKITIPAGGVNVGDKIDMGIFTITGKLKTQKVPAVSEPINIPGLGTFDGQYITVTGDQPEGTSFKFNFSSLIFNSYESVPTESTDMTVYETYLGKTNIDTIPNIDPLPATNLINRTYTTGIKFVGFSGIRYFYTNQSYFQSVLDGTPDPSVGMFRDKDMVEAITIPAEDASKILDVTYELNSEYGAQLTPDGKHYASIDGLNPIEDSGYKEPGELFPTSVVSLTPDTPINSLLNNSPKSEFGWTRNSDGSITAYISAGKIADLTQSNDINRKVIMTNAWAGTEDGVNYANAATQKNHAINTFVQGIKIIYTDPTVINTTNVTAYSPDHPDGLAITTSNKPGSDVDVSGQSKVKVHYVDAQGNPIAATTTGNGWPTDVTDTDTDNDAQYAATPATIAGFTLSNTTSIPAGAGAPAGSLLATGATDVDYPAAGTTTDVYYVYEANTQNVVYNVIDDTTSTTLEDKKAFDSGKTSANLNKKQADFQAIADGYAAKGYEIVSVDPVPATFDNDDAKDQVINIHLKHATTTKSESKVVKETVHYVYSDGSKAADDATDSVEFTRDVTTDSVTGKTTNGDWKAKNNDTTFDTITSPVISGYTPNKPSVAKVTDLTADSKDVEVTVTYTAGAQNVLYNVVDDTDSKTLEDKVAFDSGKTSANLNKKQADFQAIADGYVAKGYEIVSVDKVPAKFDNDSDKDQIIEIHLKHATTTKSESKVVNETIHYVYSDGSEAADDATDSVEFTRDVTTDSVTGKTVSTGKWVAKDDDTTFDKVNSPEIKGFTPDKPSVAKVTDLTADSKDVEETVTYSADDQKVLYNVVDDTAKTTLEDKVAFDSGKTNTDLNKKQADFQAIADGYAAKGYEIVSVDPVPAKFDNDSDKDQIIEIHLKHATATKSESKVVKETVHYVYSDGSKAAKDAKDVVTFTRTAEVDKVTGDVTFTDWKATNDDTTFDEVVSPEIKGFTADKSSVAKVTDLTADSKDVEETVTYTADKTPEPQKPTPPVTNKPNAPKPNAPMTPSTGTAQTTGTSTTPSTTAKVFPKTGEKQSIGLSLGGLAILIVGLFALVGRRKERK